MIASIIGGILGTVGSGVKGFFSSSEKKSETINRAMEVLGDVSKSEDQRAAAISQIIIAESNSESTITRIWRPIVVLSFTALLISHLLGYTAPNITTPVLDRIFDIVQYSVFGYMGVRSADKWVKDISIGKTLNNLVNKRF